jgi:hypothetical protein
MAFNRGDRIRMLRWFEGLDEPDEELGTVLAVQGDMKLRVETDAGLFITWTVDERNTVAISGGGNSPGPC